VTNTSDHYDPAPGAATAYDTPLGITNPPIDELLARVSSKYALVIYAAKRARQINAYYSQLGDVTDTDLSELPANPLGDWIAAKQPNVFEWEPASDQVAVVAVGLPGFVTSVERVSGSGPIEEGATEGPSLTIDPDGSDWLVTASAGEVATEALWRLLGAPRAAAR